MPISLGDPTDPLNNQRPQTPGGTPPSQTATAPPATPTNPIPGASTYLGEESLAQNAYDQSTSQLLAQRNSLYHQYGLTQTGAVDPNNPYGQYETLLGSEGSALDAADNAALDRGLGTGGLAMQGEQSLRQGQGAQNLDFQNQVDAVGSDYASGMANAQQTKGQAFLQAEKDAEAAAESAAANGTPDNVAPTPVNTSTGAAGAAKKALVKKVAATTYIQGSAGRGSQYAPKPKPKTKPLPYGGRH